MEDLLLYNNILRNQKERDTYFENLNKLQLQNDAHSMAYYNLLSNDFVDDPWGAVRSENIDFFNQLLPNALNSNEYFLGPENLPMKRPQYNPMQDPRPTFKQQSYINLRETIDKQAGYDEQAAASMLSRLASFQQFQAQSKLGTQEAIKKIKQEEEDRKAISGNKFPVVPTVNNPIVNNQAVPSSPATSSQAPSSPAFVLSAYKPMAALPSSGPLSSYDPDSFMTPGSSVFGQGDLSMISDPKTEGRSVYTTIADALSNFNQSYLSSFMTPASKKPNEQINETPIDVNQSQITDILEQGPEQVSLPQENLDMSQAGVDEAGPSLRVIGNNNPDVIAYEIQTTPKKVRERENDLKDAEVNNIFNKALYATPTKALTSGYFFIDKRDNSLHVIEGVDKTKRVIQSTNKREFPMEQTEVLRLTTPDDPSTSIKIQGNALLNLPRPNADLERALRIGKSYRALPEPLIQTRAPRKVKPSKAAEETTPKTAAVLAATQKRSYKDVVATPPAKQPAQSNNKKGKK